MKRMTFLIGTSVVAFGLFQLKKQHLKIDHRVDLLNSRASSNSFLPNISHFNRGSAFIESYDKWAVRTKNDHQLLEYGPKDWVVMVAFLRLLGIKQCSLFQFSQDIRTSKSFIHALDVKEIGARPTVTLSASEALDSIKEFHIPKDKSFFAFRKTVNAHMDSVRQSMIKSAQKSFDDGEINNFYAQVANLSEEDMPVFIRRYIKSDNNIEPVLVQKMMEAKIACQSFSKVSSNQVKR